MKGRGFKTTLINGHGIHNHTHTEKNESSSRSKPSVPNTETIGTRSEYDLKGFGNILVIFVRRNYEGNKDYGSTWRLGVW